MTLIEYSVRGNIMEVIVDLRIKNSEGVILKKVKTTSINMLF